jgi:hypothetical protein
MKLCSDLNLDVVVSNLLWTELATVKGFRDSIGDKLADLVSELGICALAVQGGYHDLAGVLDLRGATLDAEGEEAAAVLQARALSTALSAEAAHVQMDGVRNLAVNTRCRTLKDVLSLDRAAFTGLDGSGVEAATVCCKHGSCELHWASRQIV